MVMYLLLAVSSINVYICLSMRFSNEDKICFVSVNFKTETQLALRMPLNFLSPLFYLQTLD